jgi:hypothetical protein
MMEHQARRVVGMVLAERPPPQTQRTGVLHLELGLRLLTECRLRIEAVREGGGGERPVRGLHALMPLTDGTRSREAEIATEAAAR